MKGDRGEVVRIVASMVMTCVVGAAVLGGVYVATARHSETAKREGEIREVTGLLALDASASVLEIRQFLSGDGTEVRYEVATMGAAEGAKPVELAFDLDGRPVREGGGAGTPAGGSAGANAAKPRLLGRMFVARRGGTPAGYVVEGTTNGYKNRIRFLVGLAPDFEIAGVRVVEHEEDPGLGAEIASREFEGQFQGREPTDATLGVTRDPMPEDWRAALTELRRMPPDAWRGRHVPLIERERVKPIYAVTGATISSRALADGVRVTVARFRSRWERIAPYLPGTADATPATPARVEPVAVGPPTGVTR